MKVIELFGRSKPTISFEFFPPKTPDGLKALMENISALKDLSPSFVTMTYGAGGGTRQTTVQLVSEMKNKIGLETIAHLTCVGQSKDVIREVLNDLKGEGIENIMALRGDPPKGEKTFTAVKDGFHHGTELVKFIKGEFNFCLGVAGYPEKHPESPSMEEDLKHLQEKVAAGGDFIVTQLFFDNKDYFAFVKRVRDLGIQVPVVAGIMPIKDVDQIVRFTQMCASKIPPSLMKKLKSSKSDKDAVIKIGIDHAAQQCEELLRKGAPGIHFYTLNKSLSTREVFRHLKNKGLV